MNDLWQNLLNIYHSNPLVVSAAGVLLAGYALWTYRGSLANLPGSIRLPRIGGGTPDTVELVRRWQSLCEGCEAAGRKQAVAKLQEMFPSLSQGDKP